MRILKITWKLFHEKKNKYSKLGRGHWNNMVAAFKFLKIWDESVVLIEVIQSLSHVQLFVTPWTAACQALYPPLSPRVCSKSCPWSWQCYLAISSSACIFSFCFQSFPASGSFPLSQLFASADQSIRIQIQHQVLPMNIQGWFPLGLTGLISLLSRRLSRVFSNIPVWINSPVLSLLYSPTLSSVHDYWKNHSFEYMHLHQQSDVSAF